MNKRYFILSLLFVFIIGVFCSCDSNKSIKKQPTTYVVISTPDGNTIAGYADDVTFHNGYATITITIGNSKYTTGSNNILIIEK